MQHFSFTSFGCFFLNSCCSRWEAKWLKEKGHPLDKPSQQALMVFVICVISQWSDAQEKPASWWWVRLDSVCSHYVGSQLSGDAALKTITEPCRQLQHAVWENLIYHGDSGRPTTYFSLCGGWKLLTHQDDMLSGLDRGPQWVIGSCGGADIGTKPVSRGRESVSLRRSDSLCVHVREISALTEKLLYLSNQKKLLSRNSSRG